MLGVRPVTQEMFFVFPFYRFMGLSSALVANMDSTLPFVDEILLGVHGREQASGLLGCLCHPLPGSFVLTR